MERQAKQAFFPKSEKLTSQIAKNARAVAIGTVYGWAKSVYGRKLRGYIWEQFLEGKFSDDFRHQLYCVGKEVLSTPRGVVTQEAIDLYHSWLFDSELVGVPPRVSERLAMEFSEDTAWLEEPENNYALREQSKGSKAPHFWLSISTLVWRKRINLPIVGSPLAKKAEFVGRGISVRPLKNGGWKFQALDVRAKAESLPSPDPEGLAIGVDVGLNVIAATSDGKLFGTEVKKVFDKKYKKVQSIRKNRQRQGLKENSPRLDRLEENLTGFLKSTCGSVANKIVASYPTGTVFVMEDLNLSGCKGQKRFCYRGLAHALEGRAPTVKVNPAYSSQMCPDCGHVSKGNRRGTKFHCQRCGSLRHADVVGGINLLGRFETKKNPVSNNKSNSVIEIDHDPSEVKRILVRLYWNRRNPNLDCPSEFLLKHAPSPSSRRLNALASPHKRKRHNQVQLRIQSPDQLCLTLNKFS